MLVVRWEMQNGYEQRVYATASMDHHDDIGLENNDTNTRKDALSLY